LPTAEITSGSTPPASATMTRASSSSWRCSERSLVGSVYSAVFGASMSVGATLMTLPFGHAAMTLETVLGPIESVTAQATIVRDRVQMVDSGGKRETRSPDQLIVAGTFASGATLAVHHRGGTQRSTGFRWEINGADGDLLVTTPHSYHNTVKLALAGGRGEDSGVAPLPVPPSRFDEAPFEAAINVALLYEALATDLRDDTHRAPSFDDALRIHQLVAAVETSAREGRRVTVPDRAG